MSILDEMIKVDREVQAARHARLTACGYTETEAAAFIMGALCAITLCNPFNVTLDDIIAERERRGPTCPR